MRLLWLLPLLAVLGCETTQRGRKSVVVDISDQRVYIGEGVSIPCSTARRGTGGRPGSYRTPLSGNLYIGRKYIGKYGHSMSIHGTSKDGYFQNHRAVLFHGARKSRMGTPTSLGCVTVSYADAARLYRDVPIGTPIVIRP